jgi:Transposase C of IS166 homeodomain
VRRAVKKICNPVSRSLRLLASVRHAHDLQTQARERAEHEREQYRELYTLVLYELERLKRQLFGKKGESVDPAQVQLIFGPVFDALARAEAGDASAKSDVEDELRKLREVADQSRDSEVADSGKRRKGHGRHSFDLEQAPSKPSCANIRSGCFRMATR